MTYFTDNPLERLMQQKPVGGRDTRPKTLPKNHRCYGCPSYGRGCNGICRRDLNNRKKLKGETE